MTRRLLGGVRAGECEVGCLVANGAPKLLERGPIREYPDHVRPVSREGTFEAVAQPGSRRRDDGIDESDLRFRHAELQACLGQGRNRRLEIYRVDRKSTRLNSSHLVISYAVFCLKKKKK